MRERREETGAMATTCPAVPISAQLPLSTVCNLPQPVVLVRTFISRFLSTVSSRSCCSSPLLPCFGKCLKGRTMAAARTALLTLRGIPYSGLSVPSPSASYSLTQAGAAFVVVPLRQDFPKRFRLCAGLPAGCSSFSWKKRVSQCFSIGSKSGRKLQVVSAAKDAPLVGNVAPDFEAEAVMDQEFVKIKLSDYIGKKYVVLFFYPLDFTFVCPTEITAFSDKYPEFEKLNTAVIGVSTDSVFSHLAWIQTERKAGGLGALKYPLVSDLTKKISRDFSILIPDQGIALRGLFIIDKEGIIQHSTINNLAIGRSVEETLRTLQAVQYVQENPDEVCPAGWKPGEKTMKPDSKLSKEYFSAIS